MARKAPGQRADKAVSGADDTGGLDRQTISIQRVLVGDKQRALRSQTERDQLDSRTSDQTTARSDQGVMFSSLDARQFLKLAKVGLDAMDALLHCCLERNARRIHDHLSAALIGDAGDPGVEIVGHARRQAAARNNKIRPGLDTRKLPQTLLPFRLAQRRSGHDKAILLVCRRLEYRKILPRLFDHRHHNTPDTFLVHEPAQKAPSRATGRVNRCNFTAAPLNHASGVDPAATVVISRLTPAQFR